MAEKCTQHDCGLKYVMKTEPVNVSEDGNRTEYGLM